MQKDKRTIYKLFDLISGRYEMVNHILSCFMDDMWRKKLAKKIPANGKSSILDLCCGSGSQSVAILKHSKQSNCIGVDLSKNLLKIAENKAQKLNLKDRLTFLKGDVVAMPFEDETFDYATASFGIRNVYDLKNCFAQTHRVLKKNGRFFILEFSMPKNIILKTMFTLYLNFIVPFLGWIITGEKDAYDYLKDSIKNFSLLDIAEELKKSGFWEVSEESLCFGAVRIYCASKTNCIT